MKVDDRKLLRVSALWLLSIALLLPHQARADENGVPLRTIPMEQTESQRFGSIDVMQPKLQALISITKSLDPYRLDATASRQISFPEVLKIAVTQNLDIKIRTEDVSSKSWSLTSSYGGFLPNINLGYRYQYLKGKLNIPFLGGGANGGGARINTPFIITNAGFTYYAFQGGRVLFTTLQNRNYLHAAKFQQKATLSDTLVEATRKYLNLLLNEAILQIRIKAVETSEAQLSLNQTLLQGGKATRLDVLQAETQLSSDRQRLIDQQIARRSAAIDLADLLNLDQGIDLVPDNRIVEVRRLISESSTPAALVKTAIENRPELKQFRELWLASQKQARINAARLQPTFQFFGNAYGIGETLSNSKENVSSTLSPITLTPTTPGTAGAIPVQRQVSRQISPLLVLGYAINWNFNGMGITDFGNTEAARAQSRQSMLELNKKLNTVNNEVRQSYLKTLSAYRKLDETSAKVNSSAEELRLAQMRFQYGVGKNIDVLKAQEDQTSALIENAQAMISYNISQAQLLRDTGRISVDSLLVKAPIKLE
jgi:OMF family outer membrane factor